MTNRGRKQPKLSEADWSLVFAARCKSKRGERLTDAEQALVERAWREDQKRYSAMEPDIFDATVPFGSQVRWKR